MNLQNLSSQIVNIIRQPIIYIGETGISIGSIFQICVSLTLIIIFVRGAKRILKQRLLVKLKIDDGNREAIAAIISYGLGAISFLIILQTNGFNLASLAVLAGGLGVGVGLGLQTVTKNFVSGLTLLVERKVKVGDFIEFDGLTGYVEEISLRSTLIRTRPGGYFIVPNSYLVEDKVLNWSYDSYISRIHIPIGVAYGSDPVLVTETLLTCAYMEPAVVAKPEPQVIFTKFGDNSLNFELWVWVKRIDREPQIKSALNFAIEYNLRQQNITIPFPQRDLWLRNPEDLISKIPHISPQVGVPNYPTSPPLEESQVVAPETPAPSDPAPKKLPSFTLRNLLPQVSYFQTFTDLELRQLIEIGYRRRLKTSEILFQENDPGDAFYIILSGSVEVFVEGLNKQLTVLEAGRFFGELSLMLGIPRTASVRALEDTILFAINRVGFEKLLQEHPELSEVIIQELGKHQEELSQRQKELRELGLVSTDEDDKNPVLWVRKRLKNLFNL